MPLPPNGLMDACDCSPERKGERPGDPASGNDGTSPLCELNRIQHSRYRYEGDINEMGSPWSIKLESIQVSAAGPDVSAPGDANIKLITKYAGLLTRVHYSRTLSRLHVQIGIRQGNMREFDHYQWPCNLAFCPVLRDLFAGTVRRVSATARGCFGYSHETHLIVG